MITNVRDYNDSITHALYYIQDVAIPWIESETKMSEVTEGSPWHREQSVLVHTQMVVQSYFMLIREIEMDRGASFTTEQVFVGALAAAFHDAGKPEAEETCFSEERGEYRRYTGHEALSVKYWLMFASSPKGKELIASVLDGKTEAYADFVSKVAFIIEMHLPFGIKKRNKIVEFVTALVKWDIVDVFKLVLFADQLGRIADDQASKLERVDEWIETFNDYIDIVPSEISKSESSTVQKTAYVLIGLPGAGKSTYVSNVLQMDGKDESVVSLDNVRLEMFAEEHTDSDKLSESQLYSEAFKWISDNGLDGTLAQRFASRLRDAIIRRDDVIVVDNTNLSRKRRRPTVDHLKKAGYEVKAVLFLTPPQVSVDRQATRADKRVPPGVVHNMLKRFQVPTPAEFDQIVTVA